MPGFHSPAAGFEAPFELLDACHDRVRRSLALLGRLLSHLAQQGADAPARQAAADVWRYFSVAAPQHHLDEERHLLPLLQASGQPALVAGAQQVLADHTAFRTLWATLGPGLKALADAPAEAGPNGPAAAADRPDLAAAWRDAAEQFIARHAEHLALEDQLLWPAARALTSPEAEQAMGQEMAARRRPPP